jgi:hypothetical protein
VSDWTERVTSKYVNVGTPLLLMGVLWLGLWVGPWYPAYVYDPRWGHNYAESLAFIAAGLAYFNRRFLSDVLALIASLLIIPASMELVPHAITAVAGGVIGLLIIADMIVERGRKEDLFAPGNRRLRFWLKSHLLRFAYLLLAHIALTYFFVRLPAGTYERELVTVVYDILSIGFLTIALAEGAIRGAGGTRVSRAGFFWGLGTMVVSLGIIMVQNPDDRPEALVCILVTLAVLAVGWAAMAAQRRRTTSAGAG